MDLKSNWFLIILILCFIPLNCSEKQTETAECSLSLDASDEVITVLCPPEVEYDLTTGAIYCVWHDLFINIGLKFECQGLDVPQGAHIYHYRVSHDWDDFEDGPADFGTFATYCDFFLPEEGERYQYSITLIHSDQYLDVCEQCYNQAGLMQGHFLIDFYGETSSGYPVYDSLIIPMQFIYSLKNCF